MQWSADDVKAMERGNMASNVEMEARLPMRQSTFGFSSLDARYLLFGNCRGQPQFPSALRPQTELIPLRPQSCAGGRSLFIHQKYRLKRWFRRAPNRTKQQHLDKFWIPSPTAPEAVPPPAPPARGDAVWFTNGPKAGATGVIRVVVSKQGVDDEYIVKLKSGTTYKCTNRIQFSMKDPADLPPPVVDEFCSLSFEVEPARHETNNEPYVDALEDLLGLGLARIGRSHQASVNLRYGTTHK